MRRALTVAMEKLEHPKISGLQAQTIAAIAFDKMRKLDDDEVPVKQAATFFDFLKEAGYDANDSRVVDADGVEIRINPKKIVSI